MNPIDAADAAWEELNESLDMNLDTPAEKAEALRALAQSCGMLAQVYESRSEP